MLITELARETAMAQAPQPVEMSDEQLLQRELNFPERPLTARESILKIQLLHAQNLVYGRKVGKLGLTGVEVSI